MTGFEHVELEIKWKALLDRLKETIGEVEDVKDLVFLIGIQELGMGYRKFTKDEKLDAMHIGLCHLLCPYGYYLFLGKDEDGWPHYEVKEALPNMSEQENELLLKEAILNYFESRFD